MLTMSTVGLNNQKAWGCAFGLRHNFIRTSYITTIRLGRKTGILSD